MKNAALAVVAICGLGALAGAQQAAAPVPTLALVNARVYTLEPSRPWAEAVAVAGSRIAAVGTSTDIRALTTSSTRVIDLAGAFVVPGFNDAHVHIDSTGALLLGVNLLDVHEPDAFTARMREAAGRLPKGSWITRGDWGAYEQWAARVPGAAGNAGARGRGSRAVHAFTRSHRCRSRRITRSSSTVSIAACSWRTAWRWRAPVSTIARRRRLAGEIGKDALGPADRHPQGICRRSRTQSHSADSVRAAARAGARRA